MLPRDRKLFYKCYKYSGDSLEYLREFRKIFYHLPSHLWNVIIFVLYPLGRVSIVIHMHHNLLGFFIFAHYVWKWGLMFQMNIFWRFARVQNRGISCWFLSLCNAKHGGAHAQFMRYFLEAGGAPWSERKVGGRDVTQLGSERRDHAHCGAQQAGEARCIRAVLEHVLSGLCLVPGSQTNPNRGVSDRSRSSLPGRFCGCLAITQEIWHQYLMSLITFPV